MKKVIFALLFFSSIGLFAKIDIQLPKVIIEGVETELLISNGENAQLIIGDELIQINSNEEKIKHTFDGEQSIQVKKGETTIQKEVTPIPIWLSIIPPLIAILLALLFREVVTSLLLGIFVGALIIHIYSEGFLWGIVLALMSTIDHYLLDAINDSGHLSIILFSMLIGAMVSVISKNGGMQGVVNGISRFATTAKSGQLATWFLGVAIFFDDYANTLIVGNTMRPITDRLKISREKLAYLVDSTAAPIAAIAFVTTWIGAELGYIESGISNIEGLNEGVYNTFISSLAYSFYPILALVFMLILILKEKDFGPMLQAERQARKAVKSEEINEASKELADEFEAVKGIKHKAYNAIIPVIVVVVGTVLGLLYTGYDSEIYNNESLSFGRKLSSIIGNADSYLALLWSSLAALLVAVLMSISQKILKLSEAIDASIHGFKTMLTAIIILCLAWALALVIEDLHTADFLTSLMSTSVSPYLIPTITFLLAAVVAFSTGSSWGTMAILYPLMLPAAWQICQSNGLDYESSLSIFHNVVACVLAGAVLGDHCSPISDTTILSSLASSCNHIDHVRTQMPYALTVGAVAILFGTLPSAFGISFFITLPISIIILYLIVKYFGKKVEEPILTN